MFFTYVIKSSKNGTYYYGHTKNLDDRIKEHNSGRVRYTKSRRPWKLHYYEGFDTKSEAYKREQFFKSISGYRYLKDKNIT